MNGDWTRREFMAAGALGGLGFLSRLPRLSAEEVKVDPPQS